MNTVKNKLDYIKYRISYCLFKLLCKKQIKEAWDEAEFKTRSEFFEKSNLEKDDRFFEAYEKVWLPLYNNFIKKS